MSKWNDEKEKLRENLTFGFALIVILFAVISAVIFLEKDIKTDMEIQAVEDQNTRTKTVSCQVMDKYYYTYTGIYGGGGKATPKLTLSFNLEDDEVEGEITRTTTVKQAQFDEIFIGDTVLCNVTYIPLKYVDGMEIHREDEYAKILQVEIVEEE